MEIENRLCIVIVNYRTPELTINCIQTIQEQLDWYKDHIVIVDNKSGGDDVSIINEELNRSGLKNLATVISSSENKGFSSGNNIGIQAIPANYYVLANSDTLFRPGAILELLEAACEHPEAGIISPRLEWPDGLPQKSCFRFHSPFSELINSAGTGIITSLLKRYDVPLPVSDHKTKPQWTSFACVMIRREVFCLVGLLDEDYFMYFEDVDFCRRAWRAGFEVLNWPLAHVVHLRGQSSGLKKLRLQKKRLPEYHYRSRSRYFRKFYGQSGLFFSNLCWLAGRSVSSLREFFMGKSLTVPERQSFDIWKGFFD
jgi:GT2 family glycosyltransferase